MERNHGATVASIHNTLMIRWKLHGKLPKWKKMGGKQGRALQTSTNYSSTASPLNTDQTCLDYFKVEHEYSYLRLSRLPHP